MPGISDRTSRTRDLNDALRRSRGATGRLMCTAGVGADGPAFVAAAINAIALFDDFDQDDDPHGEHDFGSLVVYEQQVLWKIDFYEDPDVKSADGSPVARRVLTIMLAEEY